MIEGCRLGADVVNAMPPQLTVEAYFKGELFVAAVRIARLPIWCSSACSSASTAKGLEEYTLQQECLARAHKQLYCYTAAFQHCQLMH